jgi:predicted RND superfamily exporter protein
VFLAITIAFAFGLPRVEIRTIFSDLLPKDDPFVQTFLEHPNFGDPLSVVVMVKRHDGQDLYNQETLQKVWDLTRALHLVPGVNPDTIISITTEKARYAEATPYGIDMRPLMGDRVPDDPDELGQFHQRVDRSPISRTYLVSEDSTATLISAAFYEYMLDYGLVIDHVRALAAEASDGAHEVHVVGQPILTGWVYRHQQQTYAIFAVTVFLLIFALAIYVRNTAGIAVPIIVSLVSGIWGFGLVGWLNAPIEPLLMIVPLLLVARSFSHCVQFADRYYEILGEVRDKVKASEITMGVMLAPSVLGIITDALGIIFIGLAPIPAMQRFALFAGFWALCLIPTGVILISILLSYLPTPRNIDSLTGSGRDRGLHGMQRRALRGLSRMVTGPRARPTGIAMLLLSSFAIYTALQIEIGNPVEGSNLLWEDSEFNRGVRAVNDHFPGVNSLEIILESKDDDSEPRSARTAEAYLISKTIQRIAERGEGEGGQPARVTRSFADFIEEGNRLYSGGHPKWLPVDPTDQAVGAAAMAVTFGQNPLNFSQVADFKFQNSTISLFYRDNRQSTVDAALITAREAINAVSEGNGELSGISIRVSTGLATGTIALQQAMNSVVERYHWLILALLALAIFLIASFAYRSALAAVVVLVPVMLANYYLTAAMHLMGIGLDINSVMVAVLGVGVGIDYGFYLLSRICEEYNAQDRDWERAITVALTTTGKAIMFTAGIMLIGILPWYFLSDLKFTADMGLLLAVIMLINMVLALVVLPLLMWFLKPKFAGREDLLVGESVDLSAFRGDFKVQPA